MTATRPPRRGRGGLFHDMLISGTEVGTAVCSFGKGAPCAGDAHDHPRSLFPQAGG